jgi:ABC-type multidrug transport system fused ATPase/permease subunit
VSASGWLSKRMAGARGYYISASFFTLLSAGCFIVFSWYLSVFAANWLDNGIIVPDTLLIASAFLAGRYLFANIESRLNYNAGNAIVANIKKELFPVLLHDNKLSSTDSALYVTKVSDDLKPYFSFFVPYSVATVLVSILLLVICFLTEKWVAMILMVSLFVIPIQMAVIGIGAESIHKKHTDLFLKYSAVFYNRIKTIAETVNLDNFIPQYKFLSRKSEELNKATTDVMRVAILSSAILELFVTIAIAAIAIYLGMSLMGIMNGPNYGMGYNFGTALFLLTITPYFFFYIRKFVPAESAKIGLVDKIFTRVGASDNISLGESTFMVEMNEAANIMNNLSDRSLVLFDELGRGTSTYDGISIAWAIVEYIHENPKARAKTLFATHYHELNEMEKSFKRIRNFNVSVKEIDNKVIFLRKLKSGGSEHSFGIHVARMAGMPQSITKRADAILSQMENSNRKGDIKKPIKDFVEKQEGYQLSFFQLDDPILSQVRDEIINLDVNNLTPIDALNKLNEIKKIVKGK